MTAIAAGGPEALEDHRSRPSRVWNRIPDEVRERDRRTGAGRAELSPRELAMRFTDAKSTLSRRHRSIGCSRLTT